MRDGGTGRSSKAQMGKVGSIRAFAKEDVPFSALEQTAGIPEMGKNIWSTHGRTISKQEKRLFFFPTQDWKE